jgi:hypothetical protein
VKKVPCLVVSMTDEEAFRELLLSNAQDDLKPLEIGLHVLKAVGRSKGGRGKKGGAADWARQMGVAQQTMDRWKQAAQVAQTYPRFVDLLGHEVSLSIIKQAPPSDWPVLVAAMLKGGWTKETTKLRVEAVKQFEIPAELSEIYSREQAESTSPAIRRRACHLSSGPVWPCGTNTVRPLGTRQVD